MANAMSYLATMGASITILASLTGFFAQQLVQLQDCLERDPAALVNISRTNSYNETGSRVTGRSNADFAPMVAAINVGVLQAPEDLTNTLSFGCSSGNCTFSEHGNASFSTLAISASCEDISKQIRILNETKHDPPKTPTRMYLGLDYGQSGFFEWDNTDATVIHTWIDRSKNRSELTTIYFLFRSKWSTSDWRATNCSLFPTINTYAARIKDAVLEENLVESVPLRKIALQFDEPSVRDQEIDSATWRSHRMITDYTIKNGIRGSCQGSDTPAPGLNRFMKSSDNPTYVNSTGHTNPSVGWKWWYFPKDCDWSVSERASSAIVGTLAEVFSNQTLNQTRQGGVYGSAHLRVLHETRNITSNSVNKRIQGLATAMTTIVRTYGGGGFDTNHPEYAIGTVWRNTTCMYIRWSWITFPSVMIGLTGVFLLWVAFENRGIETDRLWKSSFLAALFCEVELHEKPVGKEEMKGIAKSTSVSLEDKSATLRLVVG
jgi:hypothetical protein